MLNKTAKAAPQKIILVTDDDRRFTQLLRITLDQYYDIFEAHTGSEAIAVTRKASPDLIILDLMLKDSILTGFETLQAIKSVPRLAHIPIIVLTGWPEYAEKSKELGAADFIVKPYDADELLDMVERLIG